jgi:hypothetical protein
MEHKSDLRFLGKPRITAGEHHAKLIVFDRVCAKKLLDDRSSTARSRSRVSISV